MRDLYVDGAWTEAADGAEREIRCPADGRHVRTLSEGGPDDVDRAVAAARRAFDEGPWPRTPAPERAALLHRTADLLERDAEEVARRESLDTGKRLVESRYDVDDVVSVLRHFAGLAGAEAGRVVDTGRPDVVSRVVHEPVGVCALITPWNYPLLQTVWKVAPCLATGSTFVLKPSELTPSTALWLVEALTEAGLPPGVANLVPGDGPRVGAPLSEHPGVDLVSFTGGLVTGRRVMAAAAPTVKKIALELGGKNPFVVFADADLDLALDLALTAVFLHSGQVCSAGARLLVEDAVHDRLVDRLVERAGRIRLGGPFDDDAETGCLISAAHLAKVEDYVAAGVAEGATLLVGGQRPTAESHPHLDPAGHWYPPTVLGACDTGMRVVQEESFGPVLTVERFGGDGVSRAEAEDHAVRLANDTIYGLAAGLCTTDGGRAERVAARLRCGTVWINDFHPYVAQAEWGGYKQSGVGRELGLAGLDEYRETKHVWHQVRPEPQHWFGDGADETSGGEA